MKNNKLQTNLNSDYAGKRELLNSESGLLNYNLNIVRKMQNYFQINPAEDQQLLEYGAGAGALAQIWRNEYGIDPICIEIDPALLILLQGKGFKCKKNLEQIGIVNHVFSSNVLEHIKDDEQALRNIRKHLTRDGKIALYVPALPILFSDFDTKVGHYRRYKKNELIYKVQAAGFNIDKCFYQDSIGILVSLLLKVIGYSDNSTLGSQKMLTFYDRLVLPISLFLDRILFKNIAGKNLFLFASVKSEIE
jgi:hypothetical protein